MIAEITFKPGQRMQRCAVCRHVFSGEGPGDRHRTGRHGVKVGPERRRCRTEDEMREHGLRQDERGVWGFDR